MKNIIRYTLFLSALMMMQGAFGMAYTNDYSNLCRRVCQLGLKQDGAFTDKDLLADILAFTGSANNSVCAQVLERSKSENMSYQESLGLITYFNIKISTVLNEDGTLKGEYAHIYESVSLVRLTLYKIAEIRDPRARIQ